MTPKSFFWVAEREYLLFDPKNGFKDVFWRNHLRAPQWHYNFIVMSQHPKPPKLPKNVFLVAARQYLLFDPKNGYKDVFWRNHIRAPQWHYNFKVTSQLPKPPKLPKNVFFELPRGNTCCLTLKTALRVYFEETTYELHSDITTSKWRHNSPSHRNYQKMFFLSCREAILAVWH